MLTVMVLCLLSMFVPCLCRFFLLSFEGVRGLNFSLFRGD